MKPKATCLVATSKRPTPFVRESLAAAAPCCSFDLWDKGGESCILSHGPLLLSAPVWSLDLISHLPIDSSISLTDTFVDALTWRTELLSPDHHPLTYSDERSRTVGENSLSCASPILKSLRLLECEVVLTPKN